MKQQKLFSSVLAISLTVATFGATAFSVASADDNTIDVKAPSAQINLNEKLGQPSGIEMNTKHSIGNNTDMNTDIDISKEIQADGDTDVSVNTTPSTTHLEKPLGGETSSLPEALPTASAQLNTPALTDAQIEQFAKAAQAVEGVHHKYADQIDRADNQAAAQALNVKAIEEMKAAIQAEGLTAVEYKSMLQTVQQDTALQQKVKAQLQVNTDTENQ
ncbi:MAG: DUF4168 domain-containing protein [Vampirovibrio sp.]|nr:DUF4168 domain-containing protein [Vampirovibrio sp.]